MKSDVAVAKNYLLHQHVAELNCIVSAYLDLTSENQVYSASDFKLHKKLSLFNAYKIGKFGAKPELGSTLIDNLEN